MRKILPEVLWFGFPVVTADRHISPLGPSSVQGRDLSPKPVLMEDRPSNHPLGAPLSASKLLSPFQVTKDMTTGIKDHADIPSSWKSPSRCTALAFSHLPYPQYNSPAPAFRTPNPRKNTLQAISTLCPAIISLLRH